MTEKLLDIRHKVDHRVSCEYTQKSAGSVALSPILPSPVQGESQKNGFGDKDREPAVGKPMVTWRIAIGTDVHSTRRVVSICTIDL